MVRMLIPLNGNVSGRGVDMQKRSIYNIDRRSLARDVFGSDAPEFVRRLDSWLDGAVRMPVNIFYQICVLCPRVDVESSLREIFEHYELADFRRREKRHHKD